MISRMNGGVGSLKVMLLHACHLWCCAVVPLHVKGFPIQLIESLVTLPDTLTETTRSQHRSTAKGHYKTVSSAQDILTFYEEMPHADAAATMPSGTPKHVIAEALTDGTSLC